MDLYIIERDNNLWNAVELKERKIVYSADNVKEVKKKVHFLNNGGGFAGDTPDFFQKVVAKAA